MMRLGINCDTGEAITDIDHIRQSMRDMLITPEGSRIARRDYGSLLSMLIDQPQNDVIRLQVMAAVYAALSRWGPEAKQRDYLTGTDANVLVLSRTYANRGNAKRAAKMQWERLQRGAATFSIQLAKGAAELYTEMPVKVSGFKQQIDAGEWSITTLTHSLSTDSGFITSIEVEVKIDSLEMD